MNTGRGVQHFEFGRVFGTSSAAAAIGESPASLRLHLAELQEEIDRLKRDQAAALAVSRAEGFRAGLDQARSEREMATLSAIDAVQETLERLDAGLSEAVGAMCREASGLAMAAADVIAGTALERRPAEAVAKAIGGMLSRLGDTDRIHVRVHPTLVDELRDYIVGDRGEQETRLVFVPDPSIPPGDAAADYPGGGLVLDAAARRAALAAELEPLLDDIGRDTLRAPRGSLLRAV